MYIMLEEKTDTDEFFFNFKENSSKTYTKNMFQMANFLGFGKLEQIED